MGENFPAGTEGWVNFWLVEGITPSPSRENPGIIIHIAAKSGKHIGILPLTNKSIQPRKNSAVCHCLLNHNYSPSLVLCLNNKYIFRTGRKPLYRGHIEAYESKHMFYLSICLNEFHSHCLLHSMDYDQFLSYVTF